MFFNLVRTQQSFLALRRSKQGGLGLLPNDVADLFFVFYRLGAKAVIM